MNQPVTRRQKLITGTLILTLTGFLCRILGFFYRIFLSRTIGAKGLGIFQMLHPVYGICFAICAGSIQTALSRVIAAKAEHRRVYFYTALLCALTFACFLTGLICHWASFLSIRILHEPGCEIYLKLLAYSVPFVTLHSCINGYYYGMQRSSIPAFSQIAEQVIRMAVVFLIADIWSDRNQEITVQLAVVGHLIGEIAAAIFAVACYWFLPPEPESEAKSKPASSMRSIYQSAQTSLPVLLTSAFQSVGTAIPELADIVLPLMGSRLIISVLTSIEAVCIPGQLHRFGLSPDQAYSIYGVLTGMALPFVFFPSAISNSMAVVLLPAVAQDQSKKKRDHITASILLSLQYSLYMGIFCICLFHMFGPALGTGVFHEKSAGTYIRVLSWLCPFLYLSTTLGSILNGLGRTRTTLLHNTCAMLIRLGFICLGIAKIGVRAWLLGLLVSELVLALWHLLSLHLITPIPWNAWQLIVRPVVCLVISVGIFYLVNGLGLFDGIPSFFAVTLLRVTWLSVSYASLLVLSQFFRI